MTEPTRKNIQPSDATLVITQTRGPRSIGFMIAGTDTPAPEGERVFHWAPPPTPFFDPTPEEHALLAGVLESLEEIAEEHFEARAQLRRKALQRSLAGHSP